MSKESRREATMIDFIKVVSRMIETEQRVDSIPATIKNFLVIMQEISTFECSDLNNLDRVLGLYLEESSVSCWGNVVGLIFRMERDLPKISYASHTSYESGGVVFLDKDKVPIDPDDIADFLNDFDYGGE